MEGCPWTFERHLLVLRPVESEDNPQTVELNWCPFYVHIHGLPLRQRTAAIAEIIGSRVSRVIKSASNSHQPWRSEMPIRVELDIGKPLLRFLQVSSVFGDQSTISFSYERLLLFCYICGMIGHIARQCEKQYEEGYVDVEEEKQYGPWLCAAVNRGSPRRISSDGRQVVRPLIDTLSELLQAKQGGESGCGVTTSEYPVATNSNVFRESRRDESRIRIMTKRVCVTEDVTEYSGGQQEWGSNSRVMHKDKKVVEVETSPDGSPDHQMTQSPPLMIQLVRPTSGLIPTSDLKIQPMMILPPQPNSQSTTDAQPTS
ncbi:UNVERIFIED_CONTAM: hypothetical protein Slati_2714400 [Sesamum latifolium]|uniref:CCHC-type domain-containing protein n=1 Tax=Sesamum latifolium TaxID=2727402 RepID=A0AAW2VZE9_9LAMI